MTAPRSPKARSKKASSTLALLGSAIFSALVLASSVAGCGSSGGDICSKSKECEGGNTADEEACNIVYDNYADISDLHGCSSEYDDLINCIEDNSRCNNHKYAPDEKDCDDFTSRWNHCVGR